jgi:hypothetical protein
MRTIIVASPAANKAKKIEGFGGRTWGDLKAHPVVRELMVGSVEAIVNPGNVTLNREDAVLPEGDFKLYLVPTKNKAGISESEARQLGEEIAAAIVKASRQSSSSEIGDLKKSLIEEIESFYDVDLDAVSQGNGSSGDNDLDASLREARGL